MRGRERERERPPHPLGRTWPPRAPPFETPFYPTPPSPRQGAPTSLSAPHPPTSHQPRGPHFPPTSLSGPIREVEREVDAAQARAQKNKTSPLEVLFRRLVVTNVLFPRRPFFQLTRGGADGKKQCERDKQQKLGGNDRALATNTVCMRSSYFGNGPWHPKMNGERPALRSRTR